LGMDVAMPLEWPTYCAKSRMPVLNSSLSIPGCVVVIPGARWDTKRWGLERFAEIVKRLVVREQVVLLGSPDEQALCDELERAVGGGTNVVNLAGQTSMAEMIGVLAGAKLVVGNRELLYSVVYNFCLNAMNYGGEELPSEVFVRNGWGGSVRVGVRDYGPAIPARVYREIKDGFVKKPLEIAMRPGSSGMGLYIASQFISHMHGRFGLTRHRDGTSFYVDLLPSRQMSLI